MELFKSIFRELSGFKGISDAINKKITPVSVTGISHIHKVQLIYALADEKKISLAITGSDAEAKKLTDDLNQMAGSDFAALFPSKELVFTPAEGVSREYEQMRIAALITAYFGQCSVIVASIEGALQPCIPPDELIKYTYSLKVGEEIKSLPDLCRQLAESGYERCEKVEGAGQFSVRGAILDIFPAHLPKPVRIELWGDEIESISQFDIESQRRIDETVDSVSITPVNEVVYDNNTLADSLEALLAKLRGKKAELVRERLGGDVRRLRGGEMLSNSHKYYPLVYGEASSVFDYINGEVIFCEYSEIMETANNVLTQHNEDVKILIEDGQLCKGLDGYYYDLPQLHNLAQPFVQLYASSFMQGEHNELKNRYLHIRWNSNDENNSVVQESYAPFNRTKRSVENQKGSVETTKSSVENEKSSVEIVRLMTETPKITAAQIAERLGITMRAVEKQIAKLRTKEIIKRVGPNKGGHWEIIEKT